MLVAATLLAAVIPSSSMAASDDDVEVPPAVAVWTEVMVDTDDGGSRIGLARAQDQWWVLAGRANTARVLRSADGETFESILLAPPPESGRLTVEWLFERADGDLVAYGERGTNCSESDRDADGYRDVTVCTRVRPVVYRSDDGGSTWQLTEPESLAPPSSNAKLRLADVVHDGTQFVAAANVLARDWHVRLYTSPDGEQWTLRRELRDPRGPLHAVRLLFDGDTYLLHTHASPCSEPHDAAVFAGGWGRGSYWAEHDVFYAGADIDGLGVLAPGTGSLVPEPMEVDCTVTDGFAVSQAPYPSVVSDFAAGHITLLGDSSEPAGGDPTVYRLARLVDDQWEQLTVDRGVDGHGEPAASSRSAPRLTEVDGRLAIIETRPDPLRRSGAVIPYVYVHDGGDAWAAVPAVDPVFVTAFTQFIWHDEALVAGGFVRVSTDKGFADLPGLWRATTGVDDLSRCEVAAMADCRGHDLTSGTVNLDFSGRDLTGIDLSQVQLATANFDGAILRDADLSEALMLTGGSLAGTDLTGANLRGAVLQGLIDADLTDTDARDALLNLAGPLRAWEGAVFEGSIIGFYEWPEPREVSLAGFDLTGVSVNGMGAGDVPPMRITDLSGTTLSGTSFAWIDLSGLEVAPDVLAEISFNIRSTCPDGEPPTGEGNSGLTCVRY